MRGFADRGGVAVAVLDHDERTVLARIVADVGLMLGGDVFGMESGPREHPAPSDALDFLGSLEASLAEPDDPAILRLLPNAAPDDREVADEFRRYTEPELRRTKVARLRRMWEELSEDGPEWRVEADDAMETAAALTDLRLVIAARLGLESDEDADRFHAEIRLAQHAVEADGESPDVDRERLWLGMLYQALTWLQDSLVAFVMGEERDEEAGDE